MKDTTDLMLIMMEILDSHPAIEAKSIIDETFCSAVAVKAQRDYIKSMYNKEKYEKKHGKG